MKKKLFAVVALGFVHSYSAENPFSVERENPFGVSEEHNPFEAPSPFGHPVSSEEGRSPFGQPESSPFGMPEERSPFERPREENPFGDRESQPFGLERPQEEPTFGRPQESFNRSNEEPFGRQPESLDHHEQAPELPFGKKEFGSEQQRSVTLPDTYKESAQDKMLDSEVDTFDKDSGNWVLKRAWWEKIQGLYEQIKQIFNEIMSARMDFISQRNRLDRELDVFYGQIGLEEGQLEDTIDECLALLKKERTEEGFLDKDEEQFFTLVQSKQRDLEQLKLDIKALQELDTKIDEALDVLFKQIDVANQYEQKAWELFKAVANELNDKVARKSYYEVEGLLKDVKNVQHYITSQFASYFSQTIQTAQTHSKSISTQMQNLVQNGLDLKKRFDMLQHVQEERDVKKDLAETEKKNKQKEQEQKPETFFGGLLYSVKSFFLQTADRVLSGFTSVIAHVQSWFERKEQAVVAREKKLGISVLKDEQKTTSKIDQDLEKAQAHLAAEKKMVEETEKTLATEHPAPTPEPLPHTFGGLTPETHQQEHHQEGLEHKGFEHNPFAHEESASHEPREPFAHTDQRQRPAISVMPEEHHLVSGNEHGFESQPRMQQEFARPEEQHSFGGERGFESFEGQPMQEERFPFSEPRREESPFGRSEEQSFRHEQAAPFRP